MHTRSVIFLLNVAHAVDHLFLLIFATAVASIAAEFGFARWEDLLVKGMGFDKVLLVLAGVALCTALTVLWLPAERPVAEMAPA